MRRHHSLTSAPAAATVANGMHNGQREQVHGAVGVMEGCWHGRLVCSTATTNKSRRPTGPESSSSSSNSCSCIHSRICSPVHPFPSNPAVAASKAAPMASLLLAVATTSMRRLASVASAAPALPPGAAAAAACTCHTRYCSTAKPTWQGKGSGWALHMCVCVFK
jgi:hypothetical protein